MTTNKSIKEIAQEAREELKRKYPDFKFSVTFKTFAGGRELNVALMTGPKSPYIDNPDKEMYTQINHYHISHYTKSGQNLLGWTNSPTLTPEAITMFKDVIKISNRENWDNSEIQTDYFDVNYYFHLAIGKWDQPYTIN